MKYPLVIFDFDGTLADSLPCFLGIMDRLSEQHGFRKIAVHDLEAMRRFDARQLFQHLGIPFWKLPGLTRQIRRLMAEHVDEVSLFPGIEDFLRRLLGQGVDLAIVSSNSWENIRRILGPENTLLFQHTECEASIFGKRPKLRRVLRKSGHTPDRAIYIGDEIRDLQAAHAEGLAFGAVTWGHTPADQFRSHGPQEVFETVEQMTAKLV